MNNFGIAILLFAGGYLLTQVKDLFGGGGPGSNDGSEGRLDPESKKKILETPAADKSTEFLISEAQALSLANEQYSMMQEAGSTTTYPNRKYNNKQILYAITDPLRNLNGKDLQQVYAAFGKRLYSEVKLGAPNRVQRWLDKTSDLDLFGWYRHEFNQNELDYIYTSVWKKTGLPPIGKSIKPLVKAVTTVPGGIIYSRPSAAGVPVFKNIPVNSLVGFLSPEIVKYNGVDWQQLISNAGNIIGWIDANIIKAY